MVKDKKVAAIIAEYNPFHNGHEYHIQKTKEESGADYILVLMSTNFVQRGEPAILDRYLRAEAAIRHGADAVFELPVTVSTGSADIFSLGSVALAEHLGIVDYLCFGAENDDTDALLSCASLLFENKDMETSIKRLMTEGHTFPEAREIFLKKNGFLREATLLASPNNILGITYMHSLMKLKSSIKPIAVKRNSAAHHSSRLTEGRISSAKSIREELLKENIKETLSYLPSQTEAQIKANRGFISHEDFSDLLFYKLNEIIRTKSKSEAVEILSSYQDVSAFLAGRIYNHVDRPFSFSALSEILWKKNYTLSRIHRALIHILLGVTKDIIQKNEELSYCPYIRPLAIKKDALSIFSEIKEKKQKKSPLLTRIGDIKKQADAVALETFRLNLAANELYSQLSFQCTKRKVHDERKDSFVKIV